MPCYDFTCGACKLTVENILASTKTCPNCGQLMSRVFPTSQHTQIGVTVDSHDRSRIITEKNANLKKKLAGYSYEEQNLRKKTQKYIDEKIIAKGIK